MRGSIHQLRAVLTELAVAWIFSDRRLVPALGSVHSLPEKVGSVGDFLRHGWHRGGTRSDGSDFLGLQGSCGARLLRSGDGGCPQGICPGFC